MMDFDGRSQGGFEPENQDEFSNELAQAQAAAVPQSGLGTERVIQPGPDNTVVLPAGADLEGFSTDGRDLIITLEDGSVIRIPDGAIVVPQFVIDGVAIPPQTIAALLTGNEPQPEAGNPQSSGGNFAGEVGDIQAAYALGDLLPYTELSRPQFTDEEVIPGLVDRDPDVVVVTPDNPVGAVSAIATVDEEGLPARTVDGADEPAGTADETSVETTSGTIVFNAPDGLSAIIINGVAVDLTNQPGNSADDQQFVTDLGVLTLTSVNLETGEVGFSYTLTDNTTNPSSVDTFNVTVRDRDGDEADATLTVDIIDDAPLAFNNAGTVAAATFGPITGNVLTDDDGFGVDESGADDFRSDENGLQAVTTFSSDNVGGSATAGQTLEGEYGTLTIFADGEYEYVRDLNTPGGVIDTFTYFIEDQDGSPAEAKLIITIENALDTIDFIPTTGEGTVVDESGLPPRGEEPVGTGEGSDNNPDNNSDPSETTGGTVTFNSPDGLDSILINGVVVDLENQAGNDADDQTIVDDATGTLVITSVTYDPSTGDGSITYEYTLKDNTLGDQTVDGGNTTVEFTFEVIDLDGDSTADNGEDVLVITVVDDAPEAAPDSAGQANENEAIFIDALANDDFGADGVETNNIEKVFVSSQGSQGEASYDPETGQFKYVPNPGAGSDGNLTDSFQYTIIDGDGDPSTATVTVTLQPDSEPEGGERVATVDDDGLVGGNDASDTGDLDANDGDDPADISEASFTGTLAANVGNDSPANVTVDPALAGTTAVVGTETVTYSVDGAVLTATVTGGDRDGTALFTVEITDAATGDYTVTLLTNVLHAAGADENDASVSIDFIVADSENETAPTNLTIVFDDDAPTVVADTDEVTEDGPLTATGNVITDAEANGDDGADSKGADGAEVTAISFDGDDGVVGEPLTSTYGQLTLGADGQYTYALDNDNPLVQGLDSTESLTEVFTYTITDADGDAATTTLTITINGADDDIEIEGLTVGAPDLMFDEDDLSDGTSPDATALTKTGSFTVDSPDGLSTLTVGGELVFDATATTTYPVTISDPVYGELTITDVTPTFDADGDVVSAVVDYSYTLQDNSLLHDESGEDFFTDSFAVVATDSDGSEDTASLDIRIVDDIPSVTLNDVQAPVLVTDDTDLTFAVSSTDSGNFSTLFTPDFQADGPNAVDSLVYSVAITGGNGTDSGLDDTATGNDILLRLNGNVIEGYLSGDTDTIAFTLSLDPDTGVVTQTQFRAIEHDDTDDSIESGDEAETMAADLITISATVTDADGDQASETANIGDAFTFEDDGPSGFGIQPGTLDEDELPSGAGDSQAGDGAGGTSFTGNFLPDFGADGQAADELTVSIGSVYARDPNGGQVDLTSGGQTILTSWDPDTNTLTGYVTDVTDPVFTLSIDLGAETYTFTLFKPLDHPSQDNGSGTLEGYEDNLGIFFDATFTDGDGDSFTQDSTGLNQFLQGFIVIDDDMAVATDNSARVDEGDDTGGNLLTDDDGAGLDRAGADGFADDGPIVAIGSTNLATDQTTVDGDGNLVIDGQYGTLTVNPVTGAYSYESDANSTNADVKDIFTYTIEDGDGDLSTATLTIDVDNIAGIVSDNDVEVNEKGLPAGTGELADGDAGNDDDKSEVDTDGQIEVDGASGTLEYILVGGVFDNGGTDNDASDDTYTIDGMYGTIVLNAATGTYTYTLDTAFDHDAPVGDADKNTAFAAESFDYRVEDDLGNEIGTGTINVDIIDDVPIAYDDANSVTEGLGNTTDGNVFDDEDASMDDNADTIGADIPTAGTEVTGVRAGEEDSLDPILEVGASRTVSGTYGDLTINDDGTYSYELTVKEVPEGATDTFTYQITDKDGDTDLAELVITIDQDLRVPDIAGDEITVFEDGLADGVQHGGDSETETGSFLVTDNDEGVSFTLTADNGDTLTDPAVNATLTTTKGVLTITGIVDNGDGTVTYSYSYTLTEALTHTGQGEVNDLTDTITMSISDDTGDVDSSPGRIVITIVDDVPIGANEGVIATVDDNASGENIGLAADLIANDNFGADGQGTPAITQIATGSLGGTVTIDGSGNLIYTSATDITAPYADQVETFTYTIVDGDGDTTTATFQVRLTDEGPAINADAATFTVDEEGLGGIAGNGDSTGDVDGEVTQQTGNLAGLDFGTDGPGAITLTAVADTGLNTLNGDAIATTWDANTNTLTGYDSTAVDPDNLTPGDIYFTLVITDVATGAYTFTLTQPVQHPDGTTEDDQSFSVGVIVTDAENETANGTISITIDDDSPVATDDAASLTEDTSSVGGNVVTDPTADDFGADGQGSAAVVEVSHALAGTSDDSADGSGDYSIAGTFGTLTLNENGTYTYNLDTTLVQGLDTGEFETETFVYTIRDADGDESEAELVITINGANDAPVANADTNWIVEDAAPITGNVLDGEPHNGAPDNVDRADVADTDVDGEDLDVAAADAGVINGTYGILTLDAETGAYSYRLYTENENKAAYDAVQALDDGDAPLTDTFLYNATDSTTESNETSLTISIFGANDAPVANADTNWIVDGGSPITGNVLDGETHNGAPDNVDRADVADTDVDGEDLDIAAADAGVINGTYGVLTLDAETGAYSYRLYTEAENKTAFDAVKALDDGDAPLTDTFLYNATDGTSESNETSLTISIFGQNDAPVANADTNWIVEDGSPITGNVLDGATHNGAPDNVDRADVADTDLDGEDLDVAAADAGVIAGTYGELTLDAETGAYSYRLYTEGENQAAYDAVQALDENDAPLTDTFLYNATDGTTESNETSLTITIFGANDAPVVTADAVAVSDEGLANGNQDEVGNDDTTDLATANGQIGIADVDDSSFTVTFDAIPTESLAVADGSDLGAPISWVLNDDDNVLTGRIANPDYDALNDPPEAEFLTAITVSIANDGSYTVTQSLPIFHSDATEEDDIDFTIDVSVNDGTATTTLVDAITVTIEDDSPLAVVADDMTVANQVGTYTADLDADGNVSDNYGGDGGRVIFTQASIDALVAQDLTSGLSDLEYAISADGTVLTATKVGSGSTVFTITLDPDGANDNKYVLDLQASLDATSDINFNTDGYNFVGGNDPWAGFTQPALNSQDLLVTPRGDNGDGDAINGNANSVGVTGGGGGQNVADGEGIRLDYVIDITGNPAGNPANYDGNVNQQDHSFSGHYNVNGANVSFDQGSSPSTVVFTPILVTDGPDNGPAPDYVDGVGTPVDVERIIISFDGDIEEITYDPLNPNAVYNVTVGTPANGVADQSYQVTFDDSSGSVVAVVTGNFNGNVQISTFAETSYNALTVDNISGDSFEVTGFGTTTITDDPVPFNVPISVVDNDGDLVSSDDLDILLNPAGTSGSSILSTTLTAEMVSTSSLSNDFLASNDNGQNDLRTMGMMSVTAAASGMLLDYQGFETSGFDLAPQEMSRSFKPMDFQALMVEADADLAGDFGIGSMDFAATAVSLPATSMQTTDLASFDAASVSGLLEMAQGHVSAFAMSGPAAVEPIAMDHFASAIPMADAMGGMEALLLLAEAPMVKAPLGELALAGDPAAALADLGAEAALDMAIDYFATGEPLGGMNFGGELGGNAFFAGVLDAQVGPLHAAGMGPDMVQDAALVLETATHA